MNKKYYIRFIGFLSVFLLLVDAGSISASFFETEYATVLAPDSISQDTTAKVDLIYPFEGADVEPGSFNSSSPLFLKNPSNLDSKIEYDPKTNRYIMRNKMGRLDYRSPTFFTFSEYQDYALKNSVRDYWKERILTSGVDRREGIIPSIHIGGAAFDRIFGGSTIDIRPQGSAELTFGVLSNNREDPSIDVKRRKTTSFDFKEKIQMNVIAKIGDKIEFKTNYNTESTFDFDNKLALKYEGKEDEIIKLIEAGDVTLPLPTSLITGSQSLFGIKTKLQFGRTTVTTVFSQQESETSSITVQGGAQTNEFNLTALDYEENRHFFLGQYFREDVINANGEKTNRYNHALESLPIIASNVNITRMEVWVTNIGAAITENRNIIAFSDLGEYNASNPYIQPLGLNTLPSNTANNLLINIDTTQIRDINTATNYLKNDPLGIGTSGYFVAGEDFEKIESARRLENSEYSFNSKLGFISLNTTLNPDQTLAVAYQYTIIGDDEVYQVGEFTDQGINTPKALVVKLLKSTSLNTNNPMWDLMMKNIYSIGAYQVNRDDFILNILFSGNENGVPTAYLTEGGDDIEGIPLIRLLNMDNLNSQQNPPGDGVFDFIDNAARNGGTFQSSNGRIFFPVLEPFGEDLRKLFGNDSSLASKYAYDSLYTMTKTGAEQYPEKNKFFLEGFYKSSSSNEISLNALNVPQGSVTVTAGGIPLTENVDYTVDYTLGRVRIINEGVMSSGTPIKVSLESNSMFSLQTKRLMGTHVDYAFNEKTNIGGTILNLNERPLTQKTNYGDDPISNTIWGLNFSYQEESRLLTKLVDKLPFISTKAVSRINVDGEFAHFIPGHSRSIGSEGVSYIDDFEGSKSTIDLKSLGTWRIASTPQGQHDLFPEAGPMEKLNYGKNRAKLSWFIIDPTIFYDRNAGLRPGNITTDELSKHSVRQVKEPEIFPNKDAITQIPVNIPVLNLAYYPEERGPYNYDANPESGLTSGITEEGLLRDPETRWGGMMRKIESTDFEATNVEYIEFWMMDPFAEVEGENPGKLYFNIGDISEDILRDSRKGYEQGLPTTETPINVDTTIWGRVPTIQSLVESFDNQESSRKYQDVGYDGLRDEDERSFFTNFLQRTQGLVTASVFDTIQDDPSADNYHYFRGSDYDQNVKYGSILERYKLINGVDGNSPSDEDNSEPYPTQFTNIPDMEDINRDNTLNEAERYFQYEISLDKNKMIPGENYITDTLRGRSDKLPNGEIKQVTWYQFKIPVSQPDRVVGSIQDFKSIRFLRMFMKGFQKPIVLRFATLELVRGEWRRYTQPLLAPGEYVPSDNQSETKFDVTALNTDENGGRAPIPYVEPPGIQREQNFAATKIYFQNEQSMVLKVENLVDGDSRAAYKTTDFDFRQYKNLKMFVHAEKRIEYEENEYGELTAFIRIGADFTENYYEYEIPLTFTPWGTGKTEDDIIWPEENNFDIDLEALVDVKQQRNIAMRNPNSGISTNFPYVIMDGDHKITILGTPSISDVKAIMIGVRNPRKQNSLDMDDGLPKSAEIWVNELRLSNFSNKGGWAATARVSANLADLGRITLTGSHSTAGFGGIEQKVNDTQKEAMTSFDVSADLELGKFFPEQAGIKIPVHFDYSESRITPEYNPLDPDIKLTEDLETYETEIEKDSVEAMTIDFVQRKNINFVNVRKNRKGAKKAKIYDIENLNFSYAYSEIFHRNIDVAYDMRKTYRGGFGYNFNNNPKPIKPFAKSAFFGKSPYFKLIKDFNFYLLPKSLAFRTDMFREFNERRLRNKSTGDIPMETFYVKKWDWNRSYDMKYDLTQALSLDFKANATAYIDEPDGNPVQGDQNYQVHRDSIVGEILSFGSINRYNQRLSVNYRIPINKIPLFDWITSQFRYNGTYTWTASPRSIQERLGNQIENSRQIQFSGDFNFNQLYGKIPYFKKLTQPQRNNRRANQRGAQQNRNSRQVNQEDLNAQSDTAEEKKTNYFKIIGEGLIRVALGVKRVSFNYSQNDGSFIPGFYPEPSALGNAFNYTANPDQFNNGTSSTPSKLAPGFGYVFGFQDDIRDFLSMASANQWLSPDTLLNQAVATKSTENLTFRTSFEPLPDFKVELTADRAYSENHKEYYKADADGIFNAYSSITSGSFSISTISWATAFNSDIDTVTSQIFENMKANRSAIAIRLANENPNWQDSPDNWIAVTDSITGDRTNYPLGYGPSQQDVLTYSFLAAYTGKTASEVALNQFPKIPLPNWRITYSGLSKIPSLKKIFRNVTIMHQYRSSYNVGQFVSNVLVDPNDPFPSVLYENSIDYIPRYDITMISITEQFSPLISIDVVMQNSFTAKVEIKKSRNLSFSFANNQLTEVKSDELVIGGGYRFKDVTFNVKSMGGGGRSRAIKSDLNIKADLSIRSNKTTLRRLDESINQISAGQKIISINTSADYKVNQKLNIRIFFDKVINNPFVESQYRNSTTNGGVSLRFTLNQ